MSGDMSRKEFLRLSGAAAAGMAFSGAAKPVRLAFVGVGNRGSYHLDCALGMEGIEVVALCDVDDRALYRSKRWVEEAGQAPPRLYGQSKTAFKKLCAAETLDCVICCTPWEYHAPVCLEAMRNGKHAVSEVPIVLTVDEAWELVETHEKTGRWATIGLEGFGDLTLMNMIRKGLFGDILHAEGGYVHDLRMVKFNPMEEPWRFEHSVVRNGNLYPDHPMSRIMRLLDINHGDRFESLVSMSSKAVSLNRYASAKFGDRHPFAARKMAQGDVNVSLLRTAGGKLVTLNFDTNTPHPREFFHLQGTRSVLHADAGLPRPKASERSAALLAAGIYEMRSGMIYVDGRSPLVDRWEPAEPYYQEYQHPFLNTYQPKPRTRPVRGHGGGRAFTPVTWERLIAALRGGRITDYDVYDSVTSGAISQLSEQSVAGGGAPVPFPDFTRGKWRTARPFDIA